MSELPPALAGGLKFRLKFLALAELNILAKAIQGCIYLNLQLKQEAIQKQSKKIKFE